LLDVLIGAATAVLLSWLALVVTLAISRPKGGLLKESLRLLPDLLRLLRRLTTNRDLPTGVRVRVGLLFVYLATPIDVIPDFVPILGYADDAIVVVLVLRSVCRRVSFNELRDAWPGTDDGFAALLRLVRPSELARDPTHLAAERPAVKGGPAMRRIDHLDQRDIEGEGLDRMPVLHQRQVQPAVRVRRPASRRGARPAAQ
jgi:uncharacterized membrane protein YkvA (DUF1232 family)